MADPEHVAMLGRGNLAWNSWRHQTRVKPDLSGVDLAGATLTLFNFSDCDFTNAMFSLLPVNKWGWAEQSGPPPAGGSRRGGISYYERARYRGAEIRESNFQNCDFTGAVLCGARAIKSDFRNSNFARALLIGSDFVDCNFENSAIQNAFMSEGVYSLLEAPGLFTNEQLRRIREWDEEIVMKYRLWDDEFHLEFVPATIFQRCFFTHSNFERSYVRGVSFEACDLRYCRKLSFDNSYVRDARIEAHSDNIWPMLRREYTGGKLVLYSVLLGIFFTPFILKAAYWLYLNRFRAHITSSARNLSDSEGYAGAIEWAHQLTQCFSALCEDYYLWQVLVGLSNGWLAVSSAITLIFYQLLRVTVTLTIVKFREEEEATSHTPALGTYWPWSSGYKKLVVPHYVLRTLMWMALTLTAWHTWQWMNALVSLPAR